MHGGPISALSELFSAPPPLVDAHDWLPASRCDTAIELCLGCERFVLLECWSAETAHASAFTLRPAHALFRPSLRCLWVFDVVEARTIDAAAQWPFAEECAAPQGRQQLIEPCWLQRRHRHEEFRMQREEKCESRVRGECAEAVLRRIVVAGVGAKHVSQVPTTTIERC